MANLTDLYAQGCKKISSNGYVNSLNVVLAAQALLYGCQFRNSDSSAKYVFIFDAAALPANGALPITGATAMQVFDLPAMATTTFGASNPVAGDSYLKGLIIAVSTTIDSTGTMTFTLDTAGKTFISCGYGVMLPSY